jgi:hypothetical protein
MRQMVLGGAIALAARNARRRVLNRREAAAENYSVTISSR